MSNQAYVGTTKRTFKQAVVHLLHSDYGLVGSDRVIRLMADDIEALADQFYPSPEHLRSGWTVFTGTKATETKAYPGQPVSDHQLVTISWPVVLPEDVQALVAIPPGTPGKQAREHLLSRRIARIVEHGLTHPQGPVLLTLADLSALLGLHTVRISQLLAHARQRTGNPLPTLGYHFDQGMRPSHKGEIVALYEQGLDEAEIARRSQHAQSSVGRYLRDYERVKLALKRQLLPHEIPNMTGLQPSVVKAYLELVGQYHPDLLPVPQPVPVDP